MRIKWTVDYKLYRRQISHHNIHIIINKNKKWQQTKYIVDVLSLMLLVEYRKLLHMNRSV